MAEITEAQLTALFHILTHHETYEEIESFKFPNALARYGHPFQPGNETKSATPILQSLLTKLALGLPGLNSISNDFWTVKCKNIIEDLGAAELSESYDRGSLTKRKTLATACSSILEALARGVVGGVGRSSKLTTKGAYDCTNSDDLLTAYDDLIQNILYGDTIDTLFAQTAETEQLTDHSSLVQAAHEYLIINIASFLYQIFIRSPDGQTLLRLVENIHRLVPYALLRQTLRVGNAASMINAMTRLLLSKISVGSISNWIGLSNGADEGMNLLQHVISTVYSWDIVELEKRTKKMESAIDGDLKMSYYSAIKAHSEQSREEHDRRRKRSMEESRSIISIIFEESDLSPELESTVQERALEYLSLQLSIRDRKAMTRILCEQYPDYLTQAVRDFVAAYDPVIRAVHNAADLSGALSDLERFIDDLINISKTSSDPKATTNGERKKAPVIGEYVDFLHRHQIGAHRFLHQVTKQGKEITEKYRHYAHDVADHFKTQRSPNGEDGDQGILPRLKAMVLALPADERSEVTAILDGQIEYLSTLSAYSAARLHAVVSNSEQASEPPGLYLVNWQSLLDKTAVTPAAPHGPIRYGSDSAVKLAGMVDVDGEVKGSRDLIDEESTKSPQYSDTRPILQALRIPFRALLQSWRR